MRRVPGSSTDRSEEPMAFGLHTVRRFRPLLAGGADLKVPVGVSSAPAASGVTPRQRHKRLILRTGMDRHAQESRQVTEVEETGCWVGVGRG